MNRRRFLRNLALSFGFGGIGAGVYAWRIEPHWVEFTHRRLPVKNLPDQLLGNRLVQLSDLHVGPEVSDEYLLETFRRVTSLSPEFIVYTGDFTTSELQSDAHIKRVFPHLPTGSKGTFGVLGNHDYGPGWSRPAQAGRIASMAEEAGVRILRNQMAEVDGLQVAGLDDPWARQFHPGRVLGRLDPGNASIVLSHNPDTADEPVWENFEGWILAGHTHGGQCKPPFLPPPLLPVKNRSYTSGEFALPSGRRMYINRGLGYLMRVRFNARPEVAVFTLQRA